MKLELTEQEVRDAVGDYLERQGMPKFGDLVLKVVTRDKEPVIVAEGSVEVAQGTG